MTEYAVTRTIDAPAQTIWELLTDVGGYKAWNPSIVSIDGNIALGRKIKLVSAVNPKRTFSLKVVELSAPERMVWADGMPLGLLKGVRTFTLTPQTGGQTMFSMQEVFSGLLEPLISKSIPDMTDSFAQFADGLMQAAETTQ